MKKAYYFIIVLVLLAIGSYFTIYYTSHLPNPIDDMIASGEIPNDQVEMMETIEKAMVPMQIFSFIVGTFFALLINWVIVKIVKADYKVKDIYLDGLIAASISPFVMSMAENFGLSTVENSAIFSVISATIYLVLASFNIKENKVKFLVVRGVIYAIFIGISVFLTTLVPTV